MPPAYVAATLLAWARRQTQEAERGADALAGRGDVAEALRRCRMLLELHALGEEVLADLSPEPVAVTLRRMAEARRRALAETGDLPERDALRRCICILGAPGVTPEGVRVLLATPSPA